MPSYAITGASKGIGREFVRQLSADVSNTVFAIVRDPDTAIDKKIFGQKANVHIVKGNVTDPTSILAAAKAIEEINNGKLDVLIHNANAVDMAGMALKPSQFPVDFEATEKAFNLTLLTGVYGSLWATNAFLPLIENGIEKKIIHISSLASDTDVILRSGVDYGLPYSVAKAGMNVQVAKYAVELAPKGVKVLALSPGWVNTWDGPDPMPPQVEALKSVMLKQFQRVDSEVTGEIPPEESVKKQLEVISRLDSEMSGKLVSHNGNQAWF